MKNVKALVGFTILMVFGAGGWGADFRLSGNQHLDVSSFYNNGDLYDSSTANLIEGGWIQYVRSNDDSSIHVSGGWVSQDMFIRNNSHAKISGGTVMGFVFAYDSGVVDFSGGWIQYGIYLYNNSKANITGGAIYHDLKAYNDAVVNISDGEIPRIEAVNNSQINITNGSFSFLGTNDNSKLHISGGTFSGGITASGYSSVTISEGTMDRFLALDNSVVTISGGEFLGPIVSAMGQSTVNISGGTVGMAGATNTGTLNIFGGHIESLSASGSGTILLHGSDFVLGSGLTLGEDGKTLWGTGMLSGRWHGETETWITNISYNDGTSSILLIPEPTTLLLLGLGGVMVWKRGKSKRAG